MTWLDKLDWRILLVVALLLGLAPFQPAPHLYEKLTMLVQGVLTKPMDIFDPFMHGAPLCLVAMKGIRQLKQK